MTTTTDTRANKLIINKLTQEQYDDAVEAGTISPTQLYMITDAEEAESIRIVFRKWEESNE